MRVKMYVDYMSEHFRFKSLVIIVIRMTLSPFLHVSFTVYLLEDDKINVFFNFHDR